MLRKINLGTALGALAAALPTALHAQGAGFGAAEGPIVWVWVSLVVLAVAAAAGGIVLFRRRGEDGYGDDGDPAVPPLLFPAAPASHPRRMRPAAMRPPTPPAGFPAAARVAERPRTAVPEPFAPTPPNGVVDGQTIRFHKPTDGTLQILPGRLEIVGGADRGQSIRFVRTGSNSELTFGRSEGPPYRHIQLRAPTVSRKHATMEYDRDAWRIRNLSQTNPVVVNGEELAAEGAGRPLQDGDRIEMGEVAFVFRER